MHVRSPSEQVHTVDYTHSGATTKMDPVVINSAVLLPLNTRGATEQNSYVVKAELGDCPKQTGEAWTLGVVLYWHDTNNNFTTNSTGATKCGKAASAQASGDTTGRVWLDTFFTP